MKEYVSPKLNKIYFDCVDVIAMSAVDITAGLEEFKTRSVLDIF